MPKPKLPSAIIFDFDGTIADSLLMSLRLLYELVHHAAMPIEDVSRLRGMTLRQMLRQLKIPIWRAPLLVPQVRHELAARMNDIALVPGVDEAIAKLARTHQLYVLTSNDAANVHAFLQRFGLEGYFKEVVGDVYQWSKKRALRSLAHRHKLDVHTTWYIGDQPWDMYAAHRAGMHAVAVTWGFSNMHALKVRHPELLLFDPDELVEYFAKHDEIHHV